jgi:hypothetical protein
MKRDQYMGLDVHQATTVVAVIDAEGKRVLETVVATEGGAIGRLMESMSGPLHVTLEECGQAAWLHDVIRRQVTEVVVWALVNKVVFESGFMKRSRSETGTWH